VANVVRAVLHQEALAQEQLGYYLRRFVDDAAGNRFYQYDMEQAKAGLLKRLLCLNKQVQLETIEEALHAIETDEKKKNARKLESKKGLKPDITAVL
jgi:hypothetical protein